MATNIYLLREGEDKCKSIPVAGSVGKSMTVAGSVGKSMTVAGSVGKSMTVAGSVGKSMTVAGASQSDEGNWHITKYKK